MGELTTSPFILPEPRILQLRSSAHAAHRTPTAPPTFLGCARHVLPAVWIPLFLCSSGKGTDKGLTTGMGEGRATSGSHFLHKHVLDWRVLVLDKHGLWGRRIRGASKILLMDLNSLLYNLSNCGPRDPRKHLGKTYLVRRHTGSWRI